jgi:hypothetical protein
MVMFCEIVTPLGMDILTQQEMVRALGAGVMEAGFQLNPPLESVISSRTLSPAPDGKVAPRETKAKPRHATEAIAASAERTEMETIIAGVD